jgi:hypothetical protein
MLGEVTARAAETLRRPAVAAHFARLVQRVSPKSTPQAVAEVTVTRRFLENFGGDQVRFLARGFSVPGDHAGQASAGHRWPFGGVAIVCPFNFPIEIPVLQLMGALYMGNRPLLHVDRCALYSIIHVLLLYYSLSFCLAFIIILSVSILHPYFYSLFSLTHNPSHAPAPQPRLDRDGGVPVPPPRVRPPARRRRPHPRRGRDGRRGPQGRPPALDALHGELRRRGVPLGRPRRPRLPRGRGCAVQNLYI